MLNRFRLERLGKKSSAPNTNARESHPVQSAARKRPVRKCPRDEGA